MQQLAIMYKMKNLLAHNMHNLCARVAFLPDHEYLADIYEKADDHYDAVVERMIGLGMPIDLNAVHSQAIQKLASIPQGKDNSEMFSQLLQVNKQIIQMIEMECKSGKLSEGTRQMLGGQADELEMEGYKLGQRIKK